MLFGLHIVGCGLGGVKMDQSGIRVGQSGSEWVRVSQSGSEWVRVGQSGSEHGLVLPVIFLLTGNKENNVIFFEKTNSKY